MHRTRRRPVWNASDGGSRDELYLEYYSIFVQQEESYQALSVDEGQYYTFEIGSRPIKSQLGKTICK